MQNKVKVGLIGRGWVGKAMLDLFPDAKVYVRNTPSDKQTTFTSDKEVINNCDVVFICVPSPCPSGDRLDTSIVEECVKWCTAGLIVIRSTVNPGDTYRWRMMYKKRLVFQPEYLGETPQHPLLDTKQTNFMILGGEAGARRELIELYATVYNANTKIRETDDYTAEVIKLTENRAIAFKVAQMQELYDVCEKAGVNYYTVRDAVYGDDPRFNLWWTFIYPDKRGFNSKCIPKDVFAWAAWAKYNKVVPSITNAILKRNAKWIKESYAEPTPNN